MKSVLKAGLNKDVDITVPSSELTVKQIQDMIPAKYFERSLYRSSFYVARDIFQVVLAYAAMHSIFVPFLSSADNMLGGSFLGNLVVLSLKLAIWGTFWLIQGVNFTALWVMAHECGHQAFSPYRQVNNTVGLILHSFVLVPYHSWRITHGNHHKHTNHLTKDNVFVPRKENKVIDLIEEAPMVMVGTMVFMFLLGWPTYLLFNVASQDYGRRTNHFEPSSPLFRPEDAEDIIVSDAGIVGMLIVLAMYTYKFGFMSFLCWYFVPYLGVNFWLLYITYLQHSDIRIPHYSHEEWTFVRGAIAAVDRDYGWMLNAWLHHINDSHVVHHIFSQMPFYHAIEVTRRYIKGILGDTYVEDNRPLLEALCKSWTDCRYVVPSEGVCAFYGFNKKRQ
ncbi:omega-6 fatty acid desaturase (delta-12 desaturase) [Strigomonas culicis]|uniref:Omega-6 fatty acid desaturase (Delta-12 desaturase) n=2 Tax=Strigomonas culicis TaxID=28005 RepID=S9UNR8_9TRYP|nr:omega-6 fatty acid desaturase (delta-12 desaturase) [Strigomonas culicis]EPY30563.1 omega-6 fatty acid desaturase (delta-12 desaturase) [Strigomonas culicis]EPY34438.1 omega-6 fatty acid desaturase (delta-12 desaturase) [Strigomonas culicis]|eukprot:EPY22806.1 omega-6 fatty acid desaturase (delta-12 desaturase) [Strigomonas culicis]